MTMFEWRWRTCKNEERIPNLQGWGVKTKWKQKYNRCRRGIWREWTNFPACVLLVRGELIGQGCWAWYPLAHASQIIGLGAGHVLPKFALLTGTVQVLLPVRIVIVVTVSADWGPIHEVHFVGGDENEFAFTLESASMTTDPSLGLPRMENATTLAILITAMEDDVDFSVAHLPWY